MNRLAQVVIEDFKQATLIFFAPWRKAWSSLAGRFKKPKPTMFQKSLAIHIAGAAPKSALHDD